MNLKQNCISFNLNIGINYLEKKIQGMTPVIIKIFITLYKANVSVNVC